MDNSGKAYQDQGFWDVGTNLIIRRQEEPTLTSCVGSRTERNTPRTSKTKEITIKLYFQMAGL